jgi:hypothetical protein
MILSSYDSFMGIHSNISGEASVFLRQVRAAKTVFQRLHLRLLSWGPKNKSHDNAGQSLSTNPLGAG